MGLLLPFLSNPRDLTGLHIVLEVDNLEVVHGWSKRYCKEDGETSLLLRCLHVLEAKLKCKIYVTHVKRCSTYIAELADRLSREATTRPEDRKAMAGIEREVKSPHLRTWLEWPVMNWNLPLKLCEDVQNLLE